MREVDGLGALEVRVAGHRPVEVALGEVDAASPAARAARRAPPSAWARVNSARSVATWSLRERAVWSLPPTGPTIAVSRRSTAMWMSTSSGSNGKLPVLELALDLLEAAQQRVALVVGDDPGGGEHRRVGARLGDVVGPEPPVVADRGVEPLEDGIGRLGEARHARA